MGRVINTNNPTKERNYHRRTIAELLRHLSQKARLDSEAQDMAATIVLTLRELHAGVQQTAAAWEKRGYWIKAERFVREWTWAPEAAYNLEDVIRHDAWDLLPELLMELLPRFADVEVTRLTRTAVTWNGAHARLLAEPPGNPPW